MVSSAAAHPTSGCAPAPRPWVTLLPIWMMRPAFEETSAWASVLATTNSTPWSPDAIMLLTALPPAPPTPNTTMRAFISLISVMPVMRPLWFLPQAGMTGCRSLPHGLAVCRHQVRGQTPQSTHTRSGAADRAFGTVPDSQQSFQPRRRLGGRLDFRIGLQQ